MDMTAAQIVQISVALLMATAMFVICLSAPLKAAVTTLFILVPFQLIETKYGSSNVVMTYILFAGLLVSGRNIRVPFLGALLLVLFCYLISLTQVNKAVYVQHMVFVIELVSGFLVLILMYNLAREVENVHSIVTALMVTNILVCVYCSLQLAEGATGQKMVFFGIDELSLLANRVGDTRLVGPFDAPGITAEYLAIMIIILCYELMHSLGRRKVLIIGLIAANLAFMTATANRGALLTLVGSFPLFLMTYRRTLGTMRVIQFSIAGATLLLLMAVVVVTYTQFDRMFDRLEETTETMNGVPKTRANTWPVAWESIQVKPWLGYGPRLRLLDDDIVLYPDHVFIPYPHCLYLYLLITVGIVGLCAFLFLIFRIAWYVYSAGNRIFESDYVHGLVRLGPLLLFAFMIDQIRIEFLRIELVDYQHFIFGLFGLWIGLADRGKNRTMVQAEIPGSMNRSYAQAALFSRARPEPAGLGRVFH